MNERQRRFCEEYLIDLCATRAAIRAGYSPKTAKCKAAEWINPRHPLRPEMREEIDCLLAERARQTRLSANGVVQELARIAFGDDFAAAEAEPDSVMREYRRIAIDGEAGAAGGSKAAAGRSKAAGDGVRVQDRLRALELLGKHLGIFTENMRVQPVQPVIVDEIEGGDAGGRADESGGEGGDE